MLRSPYPAFAVLTGLTLVAGSAAAQTTPPPTVAAPMPPAATAPMAPAAPASSGVDPQAAALFNQAIAAHQALPALTATMTLASVGLGAGADTQQTITAAYQKPSSAKVTVAGDAGPIVQFYTNGKTLTLYLVKQKEYRVQPVPAGAQTIPLILDQAHALLPRLIGHPEALDELLAQPGVTASIVTTAAASGAVGGVAVDTVAVALPSPDGNKAQFTFDIGKTDHLLHRLTEHATIVTKDAPQDFTLTETVTALSAAPTLIAADFKFSPPPGVTKIAETAPKAGQAPPMHDPRLVPGAAPLPIAAKDLSGKPLSLAQYKGKVVLLDFWATWCPPCVGEMPNVIASYKKYHAKGFDIVGISLDRSRPALTSFIAQNKMPWRQVFDGKYWSSAVPREYGVQAIPFGLLIGRDGKIAAVDVRGPELTAAIQKALAK